MTTKIFENICFEEIKTALIPSFQRPLDKKVVHDMKKHIKMQNKKGKKPYFGVIDICVFGDLKYVIDGQHRFEALKSYEETKFDVIFYYVEEYDEMLEIFKLRNMNVEIPSYIKDVFTDFERNLLIDIQNYISNILGFKAGSKNRPHINITNLMDKLSEDNFLENNSINNLKSFEKFYKTKNGMLKLLVKDQNFCKKHKISEKMIEQSISWKMYCGLLTDNKWLFLESDEEEDLISFN